MEDACGSGRKLGAVVLKRLRCRAAWHAGRACQLADRAPTAPPHSRHPVQIAAASAVAVSPPVSDPSGPEHETAPASPVSPLPIADEDPQGSVRVNDAP